MSQITKNKGTRIMWKLLIPVFCLVASTSSQPNYPYPGYPQQGGSLGGGAGGFSGSQGGPMGTGGFPGFQGGPMGAGGFGGSSTGQGHGQTSAQLDRVMNQLQSVFGNLEQNGFFDQFASMLGSASSSFGGSGQAATGFAKQLTDQVRQALSPGGAGQKLTQTLGGALDKTGGLNGFADRLGQITQTMSAAAGGGGTGGGSRHPPYRGYGAVNSRDIAHDDSIHVNARAAE